MRKLRSRNEELCYTAQVVIEFWNVCTRPAAARGGLDLSVDQTERKVLLIERHFVLLPDNLATFREMAKTCCHSLIDWISYARREASCFDERSWRNQFVDAK